MRMERAACPPIGGAPPGIKACGTTRLVKETGTDSLLNFLKNPCYVKCNVKVDANGECVIEDFPAD